MSKLYNIHKICHLLLSFPPDSSLKGPGSPNNHGLPSCQMFNVKLRRYLRIYPDLRFLCLDRCLEVSCKSRTNSPCLPLLIISPWLMRTDPAVVDHY